MSRDKFYCTKCFYLTGEDTPPDICPICKAERAWFDPVVKNEPSFIPTYWEADIANKIDEIRAHQTEGGKTAASFGMVTDLHWASNEKHSAAILEKVTDACAIPYIFLGGDIVCGSGVCPKTSLFRELSECKESFQKIERKCLWVLGNHDQAYSTLPIPQYYVESLTTDETYEYYFRSQALYPDRVFGPSLDYYYADDKVRRVRYIVLNTHVKATDELNENGIGRFFAFRETGLMQEQLDWLASEALDTPKDYTVVMCAHEPEFLNLDILIGMIDAYRKHTRYKGQNTFEEKPYYNVSVSVDFTSRGGDFAMLATGHMHYDTARYENGVLIVTTMNDSMHNSAEAAYKHTKGTSDEQAMDIFTIDKKAHKIYATRIGCGENRVFDYEVF